MLHLPVRPAMPKGPMSMHARSNAVAIVVEVLSRRVGSVRLRIAEQPARAGLRKIDDAVAIDGDAFASAASRQIDALRVGNEEPNLSIAQPADPHATFEGRIDTLGTRFRIGGIQQTGAVKCDPAWTSPLLPLCNELAFLIEDLNTAVTAIGNKKPALRIQHQSVRRVELARCRALLAPGLEELSILVELHDAGVGVAAMTIGDEDAAVRRHKYVRGSIERLRTIAGDTCGAECHQHASGRTELEDLLSFPILVLTIGHPDVVIGVDVETVWIDEHAGAEAGDEAARRIELEQRRHIRAVAGRRTTALKNPDGLAVAIDVNAIDLTHLPARRKLAEAFDLVWIGKIVRRDCPGLTGCPRRVDCERRHQRRTQHEVMTMCRSHAR